MCDTFSCSSSAARAVGRPQPVNSHLPDGHNARLAGWMQDPTIRDHANAILAIYLKVSLPFSRVITYADAQKLVNDTVLAVSDC